ncbi:MAG: bifunctional 23S rRNA (guanine(2069)-N(7))-methyltransferase RlmK/23S rRNA (guanine(2445)-N(2))-methyltransferase RlmL [Gammaproteobacteria bacterium]|nr:bifunctional 23S rRNA (guanine(2069)-N(7))-methyltransferase RlmK/23S rRNA (guanine(2445)-N(2))-methyltransferase RlmL [Gammaproteobacteria bacterium]NNL11838.1 bifunctional 23S rRNA (guanine(2069)-N(7))-methyltransferase RlmK/23S rRNA (guanine(2445)-N(2))-methyltransferase RlmL [Pseudomonadales bacterium]
MKAQKNANAAASAPRQHYFATCPKGLEAVLARELRGLGIEAVQESVAGCYFDCAQAQAYNVCYKTRVANRVVLVLLRRGFDSGEALLQAATACDWQAHIDPAQSVHIDFNGSNAFIRNAKYGAQLVRDALNDYFRARDEDRIELDNFRPDVRLYARLFKRRFTLGIDLVGASLHQRGYRGDGGEAPLKENLAAALLMLCDWPALAAQGASFVDPFCGSGTLLIEAALQAANIPSGYLRDDWPLLRLASADQSAWQACVDNAYVDLQNLSLPCRIAGSDVSRNAVDIARQNVARAGLAEVVEVSRAAITDLESADCFANATGLLLANPPYGQRVGDKQQLDELYAQIGALLKQNCAGWQAGILTDNAELGWRTGLRSFRQHKVYNGNIECRLLRYEVSSDSQLKPRARDAAGQRVGGLRQAAAPLSEGAKMLANRLRKNLRRLKPWLATQTAPSYRVYDADLPEYAVAIDCYTALPLTGIAKNTASSPASNPATNAAPLQYFHLQEYAAPASIDEATAGRRVSEAVQAVCEVFDVPAQQVVLKRRERQRGKQQYAKFSSQLPDLVIREGGYPFIINLGKYLDTGLFLDHRPLRRLIGERCRGKRFLNLYAYTASATVHAARGGARSSVSVDMSKTYLAWAARNFELNEMPFQQHLLERADCGEWLQSCERCFDVILLDPPSFSNSSRMAHTLDLQRDHADLIKRSMALLEQSGELYFSTNRRGFRLAPELLAVYTVEDLTDATHDPDFQRPRPSHYCWRITNRKGS